MALYQLPDWMAIAPALTLAAAAFVVFAVDAIRPRTTDRTLLAGVATTGALASLVVAVWYGLAGVGTPIDAGGNGVFYLFGADSPQLVVDRAALFFAAVIAAVTALVSVASYDYMDGHAYQAEYYSLVLLAATGMSTLAVANSLVTVFIALELSSLPSYALVAILKDNRGSVEAGLKYFLVGALSSAIMLYGISLIYGATGVLQLDAVAAAVAGELEVAAHDVAAVDGLLGLGMLMLLGGFAFKTASVPFHFWAPEAYEGAPAPISAFISSASKAAGFIVLFRVFTQAFPIAEGTVAGVDWTLVFVVLAVVTMTVGNFAAATQRNVKRMLAYSSVGHAGYVLIGLGALGSDPATDEIVLGAAMMHLLVYGFMNTGAFLFVALAEHWGVGRTFEDYGGLASRAPVASFGMAIFLFSLAGVPPLGGFWSKYYLLTGSMFAGSYLLAAALVINSALSLFYYSRLVKALWLEEPATDLPTLSQPIGLYAAVAVAAVVTVVILPGGGPIVDAATAAASSVLG